MFLQYPVRPFWQPNSLPGFPHPDVQRLTQQLDTARREIAQNENKIRLLLSKLRAYRKIIRCRESSVAKASVLSITDRLDHIPPPCRPLATISAPPTLPSSTSVKATAPDNWSIVYNAEVKRSIEVNVAHTFKYAKPVRCVKFSLDGKYLAIGLQWNGTTRVFDITTGKEKCVLVDRSTKDQVSIWAVCFSPDSKYVATAGSDRRICIWELEKGRLRAIFKDHRNDVYSVAFSPDGRFLVSGSYDESVRIWRLRDGSSWELLDNALGYFAVCFSPDGQHIASANCDNTLRIWCTRTGKLVEKWTSHTGSVWDVAYTPDGKGLISGSNDLTIKYWNVGSITIDRTASNGDPRPKTEIFKLEGHAESVRSVTFLPDSQLLLSGSADRSVRIWNAQADASAWQCTLSGHKHRVATVDSSRAGNYLASGSLDGGVVIWKYDCCGET